MNRGCLATIKLLHQPFECELEANHKGPHTYLIVWGQRETDPKPQPKPIHTHDKWCLSAECKVTS